MNINRWELSGSIENIETKTSKAGKDYWKVTIESGESHIPVVVFSPPPPAGTEVKVTGRIGAYMDNAKLENARLEATGGSGLKDAAPVDVPETVADGSLPF